MWFLYALSNMGLGKQQRMEETMINFEEELKKFYPSLEVEDAEDALYKKNLTDIADLVVDIVKEIKEEEV